MVKLRVSRMRLTKAWSFGAPAQDEQSVLRSQVVEEQVSASFRSGNGEAKHNLVLPLGPELTVVAKCSSIKPIETVSWTV